MGQYDRNRDAEGRFTGGSRGPRRWRDDDYQGQDRENYGRGVEPPRDDRGRFMSEGENGDYYGGGRQEYEGDDYGGREYRGQRQRGRDDYGERDYGDYRFGGNQGGRGEYGYEDNDDGFRSGGRGDDYGRDFGRNDGDRERDEHGRFTSDDDDRRGRFSRGRDDGDEERDSRGRGSGQGRGWFGDPRGHAEAARERSQESRRPRYDDDNDRGNRGSNRGDRERDESGRFASSDDDDRGRGSPGRGGDDHRGWYGDHRGHSQAARLGWRHRNR